MKKNISINISGIIFHIEEDGYETLKRYLDSINKYFSTFEDSSEILADIESRIAEIFLSKLNEEKQVITVDDVNGLMATMGSVSDFRAVEDQEEKETEFSSEKTSAGSQQSRENAGSSSYTYSPPKQLMRDQKRKILGGVCAGLANYFNIDALWIRLIFAVLTFAYGLTFFVYVVMWILVPGSYDLDEPIVPKKMYRDPEKKVIGGVASGLAAFLGVEIVVIRVLFVVFLFIGGLGLFIYILLWLILPEAKTLTDKIQMQGDPVTLSNIESTLKKNQYDRSGQEESPLTRVLLFPFRLLGIIFDALGKVLGGLLEVVRVGIGVLIVVLGIGLIFSIVTSAGILFGIITTSAVAAPWFTGMNETRIPIEAFVRAFPTWTAIAAFFTSIIPSIFIVLLGVSVIAKRIVFNAATGWTMFVLFFVSIAMLAVSVPKLIYSFKQEAGYTVENVYRISGKKAVLKINETGLDEYHAVDFDLEGHDEKDFKLVQKFQAQGSTRQNAIENAKMVSYNVDVKDSVFTFDSNLQFSDDAIFRAQRLKMTLYIPYYTQFSMDEGISRLISHYIDHNYLDGYVWQITPEDGLQCVSCPKEEMEKLTDLRDFDELEINGKFNLRVTRGDDYGVELSGAEDAKDKYEITRQGETLIIDYSGKKNTDWKLENFNIPEVRIVVTMPTIEKIEAVGVGEIKLDDFTANDFDLDLRGPIKFKGDISANDISMTLSGTAEADIEGHANNLEATIELASRLRAYGLQVQDAFIETSGASSAKVNVTGNLEIEESIPSKVEYRGDPNVVKRN